MIYLIRLWSSASCSYLHVLFKQLILLPRSCAASTATMTLLAHGMELR